MAPRFLKELRRRSKASFRTEASTDTSSEGAVSHGTAASSGSVTPPSIAHNSDPALNLQLKDSGEQLTQTSSRLALPANGGNSSRLSTQSVPGISGLGSPTLGGKSNTPLSKYAPRVYQKTILLHGTIGEPSTTTTPMDGTITLSRLDDDMPATSWPVCDSHFKAMAYLNPGPNKLRFDFASPKLANSSSSNPIHSSHLTIHMIPSMSSPPLQLAIVLAKDSPATYSAAPTRAEREGNGLETAIRKYRMAAYLWQAFTAEQMWRNKMGRRTFRFEEEWTTGSTNYRDRETGNMRSEARVHVIRSDKTVAELQQLADSQKTTMASREIMHAVVTSAVSAYFQPLPGQKNYVAAMLLDTDWGLASNNDPADLASASNPNATNIALLGSQHLQHYPSSLEEIVPSFTDCTPTDTQYIKNQCSEAGSSWEAANAGIGAHLQQVGRLFGCPRQETGVMLKDYVVFSRTFVTREAYSTRTKAKGGLALQGDECAWHRLDCLRFRAHPAFRIPRDPPARSDASVQAYAVENGTLLAIAPSGISFIEIYGEGDQVCRSWMEFPLDSTTTHRQISLSEQDIITRLPETMRKGPVRLSIKSHGGNSLEIDNVKQFISKAQAVKIKGSKQGFRSCQIGTVQPPNTDPEDLLFSSAQSERVMVRMNVYHDADVIYGLEFVYDNDDTQLFGTRAGKVGGDTYDFDLRRGEYLSGFTVKGGPRIHGIQLLTSLGHKSRIFGNPYGGSSHTILPPRGYTICGVSGTHRSQLDSISAVVTR
ncbi:Mannose-binding lectin [Cordyceps militaris CM01]|uniref:Mannose-binding lectin n=2 Tax=Cordyceps militaris TaxID=73501 RepID=G3J421_CORMM|nr:Mannose-binding lectin [Cordyceps militaris CM01]ATY64726.1 Mannose-binding lectin [Cordyceps militaris]EGX96592.1 Mannose-binding lectin [Cordyceps militaris CM01]